MAKVLAFMVQRGLDEYKKVNPEWPVRVVSCSVVCVVGSDD